MQQTTMLKIINALSVAPLIKIIRLYHFILDLKGLDVYPVIF